ncbi:MAG: RDD family protein [Ginsengibacter sp.]
MPLIPIATIFNIDLEFEIAGVHKRIFAYLVDFTILILFFMSMKYFYYGGFHVGDTSFLKSRMGLDILTISLPMLLYSLIAEVTMHGQTIGKKLLDIRVISLEGGEPLLSQYLVRWMFKVFEWPFFFGYTILSSESLIVYITLTGFFGIFVVIFIGIAKKSQRLGDLAANTVVVDTRSPFTVEDTIFMEINDENFVVKFPEVLKLSDRDINTIKNVVHSFYKEHNEETSKRVALKIQNVLSIRTDMKAIDFLEKLLADYNYLAAK